ncbi:serine protease [Labrys miyagiensis]|uniref:Phospholipase D n=1 Tax=Labrys miyagiensis TaxID=346912 RepID=A0ABQ6CBE6_9HYPH|nr:phospholipase D-like domain-containing protein [Labrys miyagiensis]GLS17134.1 serine protease [Labrys miyagiensis]
MTREETEDFVRRLLWRNPDLKSHYASLLGPPAPSGFESLEPVLERGPAGPGGVDILDTIRRANPSALEAIVDQERPVFFALPPKDGAPMSFDIDDAAILGPEAGKLRDDLGVCRSRIEPLLTRIGRIDIEGFASMPFVGTGWIVDDGIVATNRHVAELFARQGGEGFAFRIGSDGEPLSVSLNTGHFRNGADGGVNLPIASVLYIEPEASAVDIAFLKLSAKAPIGALSPLPVAEEAADPMRPLCAIGYPARAPASVIPDQALMQQLYRGSYDVKRLAPGYLIAESDERLSHDCTTLGGSSGSCVVAMATGEVVGLHFAGIYMKENQAVPARILRDYVKGKLWLRPPVLETSKPVPPLPVISPPPQPQSAPAPAGDTVVTVTIRIAGGGQVTVDGPAPGGVDIEAAVTAFLDANRHEAVLAGRVGYLDEDSRIGDTSCIAISVKPALLDEARKNWPASFQGHPVRYEAADVGEQLEAYAALEAVGGIAYDDEARQGPDFTLAQIVEPMTVRAHVSPEYGFEELTAFLQGSGEHQLVSAMYEFKGAAIADLVGEALDKGASMALALDNVTLPAPQAGSATSAPEAASVLEFEAAPRFEAWRARHGERFDVVTVPEGPGGLIMMAYHIKVTVRDDDWLWLSSGNWKNTSSQPIVSQEQRDNAANKDLPGNRDWHVVMHSPGLATRFRSHIRQDIKRSRELAARKEAAALPEPMILVPDMALEAAVEERRPPSRILAPLVVTSTVKATPVLTPDLDGRVYTDAVLRLIRSAKRSLWFQIPYIGMRRDPRVHRGNIDELIDALVEKLMTLEEARVLLRTGNREFSDNRHVAWYFKSKGVDVENRLRAIDNHHTKGMVVDGERVLIGSHNWSGQGVSVNRDASIIFENGDLARYYGDALDIDWQRANPVRPVEFVKKKPQLLPPSQAVTESPGYRAMTLSAYLAATDD